MSNSIGRRLATQSSKLLNQHKSLYLFMSLSSLLSVAILLWILIPLLRIENLALKHGSTLSTNTYLEAIALIILLFFAINFLNLFFMSGLIRCALTLLHTQRVQLLNGFKCSFQQTFRLIALHLIGNHYALYLRFMQYWVDDYERSAFATKMLASLPWSVAIQFVLPLLVEQQGNTQSLIQQSAQLIDHTWPTDTEHTLKSQLKPGRKKIFIQLFLFVVLIITVLLNGTHLGIISIVIITLSAGSFLSLGILGTTLQTLTIAATYCYAKGFDTSRYYDQKLLKQAFRPVRRKIPR